MGFFGGQTRQDPVSTPSYEDENFEDAFDSLPTLPKPQDNTVIAKGITFTGGSYRLRAGWRVRSG